VYLPLFKKRASALETRIKQFNSNLLFRTKRQHKKQNPVIKQIGQVRRGVRSIWGWIGEIFIIEAYSRQLIS